jgi:hypothetical protein
MRWPIKSIEQINHLFAQAGAESEISSTLIIPPELHLTRAFGPFHNCIIVTFGAMLENA